MSYLSLILIKVSSFEIISSKFLSYSIFSLLILIFFLASKTTNKSYGEVLNIGSGKNISINKLANLIGGDKIYLEPVNEPFANLADISKAKELLSWSPKVDIMNWLDTYLRTI